MEAGTGRFPRHLVAILYADVVGFSRMTEADEDATYRAVRESLDFFASRVVACNGEVKNYAGDAILAKFHSAEDALLCAACVQNDMPLRNASIAEDSKIRFRIGLNLGDIIEDRGDIFGDGVNVAARLEGLARPEGICVSGSFYDAVVNKLPFDFEFMGEQQVKNINKPIRSYHASLQQGMKLPEIQLKAANITQPGVKKIKAIFSSPVQLIAILIMLGLIVGLGFLVNDTKLETTGKLLDASSTPGISEQPSIIVLPFVNLSNDPEQKYFSDGITDDLITDLGKISGLSIIARRTALSYRQKDIDLKQLGQALKVKYVLEGSVRKASGRIRINAQLTDSQSGLQVWAERYDREIKDIFSIQDEVRKNIVSAMSVKLTEEEHRKIAHRFTSSVEAYDFFLKGQSYLGHRTREGSITARELYTKAINIDPRFARAYSGIAITYVDDLRFGWSTDNEESARQAVSMADKALELDANSPQAHWALGYIYLFIEKNPEKAIRAIMHSLDIDHDDTDAMALLAISYIYSGNYKLARQYIRKAMDISVNYPSQYINVLALAYLFDGENERACTYLNEAWQRNTGRIQSNVYLIVCNVRLGKMDDAYWQVEQLKTVQPGFSLDVWAKNQPILDRHVLDAVVADLEKAGL